MEALVRECINCKKVYGCILKGHIHRCTSCGAPDACVYRKNVNRSKALITGGLCEYCWHLYKIGEIEPCKLVKV